MFLFLQLFISSDVLGVFIVDCIWSLHCFFTVCQVLCFCVVVPRVLQSWEKPFDFQAFLTLNSFLLLSRLPYDWQISPWRMKGFLLRFEIHTWSICLFESYSVKRYNLVGSIYMLGTATDYYINHLSLVLNSLY